MAGEKEQILPACSSSSKFFHNLILNVSFLCGGTSHLARGWDIKMYSNEDSILQVYQCLGFPF